MSFMRTLAVAHLLAKSDLKVRYGGTALGIAWVLVQRLTLFTCISWIFARLLGLDTLEYFLYVAFGMSTWLWITSTCTDCAGALDESRAQLLEFTTPPTVYVFKTVLRNMYLFWLIILIPVCVAVYVKSFSAVLVGKLIVGIVLVAALLFPLGVIFSIVGCRFKDFRAAITSVFGVVFYATPIIWSLESVGGRASMFGTFVAFNPFYYVLSAVREPVVSGNSNLHQIIVLVAALVLAVLSKWTYGAAANRIRYWI